MFAPLWQSLQFEDVLLFLWVAIGEPVLYQLVTRLLGDIQPWNIGSDRNPWLALLFLGAGVAGLVVVGTRAPGQSDADGPVGGLSNYSHMPLLVTLAYMFLYGFSAIGTFTDSMVAGLPCLLLGFLALVAVLYKRLPTLDVVYRRILIAPMILLGSWNFSAIVREFYANTDWRAFLTTQGPEILQNPNSSLALTVGLLFASLVVFYLVFIFAPRQVAYPTGSVRDWGLRFGLFLIALVLNLSWFQFF